MNTSNKLTISGCVLALTLGATLPLLIPDQRAPVQASATSKNDATSTILPGRQVSAALQNSIKSGTGATRWLQLLSTLENAKAEDMPGLIRVASSDSAMIRMLAARWAELDPDHMFRSIYADYMLPEGAPSTLPSRHILSDVLFEQWTKSDLKAAIKALTDVPDFSGREQLRMTVSDRVMQVDVEEGLRVLKEWSVQNYLPDMKKVAEWAGKDPQHAAEVVLSLGENYGSREALKQVGKAWGQRDPGGGLRFAAGLDAGMRGALGSEIMASWAASDLRSAVAFATDEADLSLRASVSRGLVSAWAKSDPAAALAWSQEHLRGVNRAETIGGLIKTAAEKDLTAAADLAAGMEPGVAQNKACVSIFETWFNKGPEQRDAAFTWLAALPDSEAQRAALERVQWNWAWKDPDAVKDFISGPHGSLASSNLINQVARNQAARNPETAMEWARSLPAQQSAEARRAVFDSWLSMRPQNAAEYARNLPAGPERETAIRSVSQTLVYQSPEQAVSWYRKLSVEDQKLAREVFDGVGLPSDRRQQLNEALNKL